MMEKINKTILHERKMPAVAEVAVEGFKQLQEKQELWALLEPGEVQITNLQSGTTSDKIPRGNSPMFHKTQRSQKLS